jgi:hypothetical protein
MKRLILCVIILTLSLVTLAEAGDWTPEPRTGRWDFSIMTRYSWSQEVTQDTGSKIDFDSDLGWGFGFSKYLSENFNLGLVFSWHSTYYTATAVGETAGDTHVYSNTLSTSAVALYGDYAFGSGSLKPYISGNLGWARANTNIIADVDGGCYYYPYAGYVCGTQTSTYGDDAFTYGLGLGLRLDISPAAFLKVGWEHSWADFAGFDSNDVLRVDLGFLL